MRGTQEPVLADAAENFQIPRGEMERREARAVPAETRQAPSGETHFTIVP
jgi:hypothetical protein